MGDPLLPIPSDDLIAERFSKIKPRLTTAQAVVEASRCLFCHDAPCMTACPTGIDVSLFIRQIMSGDPRGSAETIFSRNILGRVCGEVCPTKVLCEGACVYNGLNAKPIEIGRLQAYATNHAITNGIQFASRGPATGKKVAVIGGGPAGLACAHELSVMGHAVTVYDANERLGGLNAYGVAPYKYSNDDAAEEVAYLASIGFAVRVGCKVENNDLRTMLTAYDAIFLAIGLGGSKRLGIPGVDKSHVYGAAEFIYRLRVQKQRIAVGRHVVVVGGGNTAVDVAVESAKLGASVIMIYRRTAASRRAYDFEIELARRHEVTINYLTSPLSVLGDGQVTGLKCVRNEMIGATVRPVPGSDYVLPCDMVIFATGQERLEKFCAALDIGMDAGRVRVNADFQTSVAKIFAGGDCVNGGKEVVNAVAHGRDAAKGIDRFLQGRVR